MPGAESVKGKNAARRIFADGPPLAGGRAALSPGGLVWVTRSSYGDGTLVGTIPE